MNFKVHRRVLSQYPAPEPCLIYEAGAFICSLVVYQPHAQPRAELRAPLQTHQELHTHTHTHTHRVHAQRGARAYACCTHVGPLTVFITIHACLMNNIGNKRRTKRTNGGSYGLRLDALVVFLLTIPPPPPPPPPQPLYARLEIQITLSAVPHSFLSSVVFRKRIEGERGRDQKTGKSDGKRETQKERKRERRREREGVSERETERVEGRYREGARACMYNKCCQSNCCKHGGKGKLP